MDHCRGFLGGLLFECLLGPVLGNIVTIVLCATDSRGVKTELGWIPALVIYTSFGVRVGGVLGSFLGAIQDARRVREPGRRLVVILLSPLVGVLLFLIGCFLFLRRSSHTDSTGTNP